MTSYGNGRTFRMIMALAALLGAVCAFGTVSASEAEKPAEPAKPVPAEKAGWKLVFEDKFDRDELGDNWKVVDGTWEVKDGHLRGSGTLITSRGYPGRHPQGFLRMEFDAVTDVRPLMLLPGGPKPKVTVGDVSSFLHAQPPEKAEKPPFATGYFFQFGGFHNTRNELRRAGQSLASDRTPTTLITPDQTHRIIVENDAGHVRLFVDDKLVIEHQDSTAMVGDGFDRAGFYFYTAAKVKNVKIYVKWLADDLDLD